MQLTRSLPLFLLAHTITAYILPNPPGKYNVTLTNAPLIDYSRNDPYAPKPTPRALMLSIFQPATCKSTIPVPYMPNKTAKYQGPYLQALFNNSADLTPLFLEARLPVCQPNSSDSTCKTLDNAPILLFSPGYAIPRLYYSVLASAISSEGFTVITIDHPEDANIITFPDGRTIYNNASIWDSPSNPYKDEYPRAEDASFVLDQLKNASAVAQLLPARGPKAFNIDRVGMLGHSLGGATAIVAAIKDKRIKAVINWDGSIFGPPATGPPGLSQPVLFVGESQNPQAPTWSDAWPRLGGPKLWVRVEGTTHETFSDVPSLLKVGGGGIPKDLEGILGTIAPERMVTVLAEYTAAWMNSAFAGGNGAKVPSGFSEVSTVMKGKF